MRESPRCLRFKAVLVSLASLIALGCNDSNDVTSPAMGAVADVSGNWSGPYDSTAPAICATGTATAALVQDGDRVTGSFKALSCGIAGRFQGRVSGNMLTGTVSMSGCTGGAVTGRLDGGTLLLTVGDFQKTLVAGDVEVLPGGQVNLQR